MAAALYGYKNGLAHFVCGDLVMKISLFLAFFLFPILFSHFLSYFTIILFLYLSPSLFLTYFYFI